MIAAFFASLRSLLDWHIIRLMIICAVLTAGLLLGSVLAVEAMLSHSNFFGNVWYAGIASKAVQWAGTGAATFAAWFLAPLAFPLISSLFLDSIVGRIETRYYQLPPSAGAPLAISLKAALQFLLVSVLLNLLILPLMFLLPFLYVPLYYLLNARLYGREYLELVALRYHSLPEVKELRRQHWLTLYLAGFGMMLLFTMPLVNIVAPVLSAVAITHLYFQLIHRKA